jgi:putative ABC transport system permease protein
MLYRIAFRNILRNRRRSMMSMLAISVGAIAMLLFGAFVAAIILGLRTRAVETGGHLTIYKAGYLDFGSGNPGAYAIEHYADVMALVGDDPVLKPMLAVVTPRVLVYGVAGNFKADRSKTFFGVGFVPSDRQRMNGWDEYGMRKGHPAEALNMSDDDPTRGVVGAGLARILGLCEALKLDHCPKLPDEETKATGVSRDFSVLAQDNGSAGSVPDQLPSLDLLAATAAGAPNVVSLRIGDTSTEAVKEIDDSYVGLPLPLSQQLLFGRGEQKVTSIVLQLRHTADLSAARTRLLSLFDEHHLKLDVRDYTQLNPMYLQVLAMFGAIFGFIAVVMAVIVLFTVTNTMSMTVVERTAEIGTLRAMGVQRGGIRAQFLAEGLLLGVIGASAGVVLAIVLAAIINGAGLHWTPPGYSTPVPLRLLIGAVPQLLAGAWLALVAMAALAALLPATRAARLQVVDALRHV